MQTLTRAALAETATASTLSNGSNLDPASAFSHADEDIITHQVELDEALVASTAQATGTSIQELYDIKSTAAKIVQSRDARGRRVVFKNVALQFPDEMLCDSVPVHWALKKEIKRLISIEKARYAGTEEEHTEPELYVMADTSYGNCCVDEVAAAHVSADLVVHYGHACLSLTARLPTLYVFSKLSIDVSQAANSIFDEVSSAGDKQKEKEEAPPLVLLYEVGYAHQMVSLEERLEAELQRGGSKRRVLLERIDTSPNFEDKLAALGSEINEEKGIDADSLAREVHETRCGGGGSCCNYGGEKDGAKGCICKQPPQNSHGVTSSMRSRARHLDLPANTSLSDCDIAYIGGESLYLTNLLLSHPPSSRAPRLFITYDPRSSAPKARIEDGRSTNRLLMRRYALVQKAKDASVIGLLVGTLGVRSYLPLLQNLRSLLTGPGSRRKVYTISVGKLNPAKLANFQEIDLFVLVACPENSLALHGTGGGSHVGKDYFRPVITPFEMVVALRSQREGDGGAGGWGDGYELDLERLNLQSQEESRVSAGKDSEANGHVGADERDAEGESDEDENSRPHFSLVSGSFASRQSYRPHDALTSRSDRALTQTDATTSSSRTIAIRQNDGTLTRILDSASPAHLEGRAWKGLETRTGMDAPAALEDGRAGIARGYVEADGKKEGEGEQKV